jgi:fibronectin-binding autotransporter adhesin
MAFASKPATGRRVEPNKLRREKRSRQRQRRRTRFLPLIDPLEPRNLLATFTVFEPVDYENGSLRWAIEAANESAGPDTIVFDLDEDVESIVVEEQLLITDDVTIEGPGATALEIVGDGDRIFAIVPAAYAAAAALDPDDDIDLFTKPTSEQLASVPTVAISRLTLSDGTATNALGLAPDSGYSFGGGIYNLGGNLTLDRVHMTNNTAQGVVTAGGAVANEFGGTLTVIRSAFEGNQSTGGVIAVGGAITSDLGSVDDGTEDGGQTKQPVVTIDRTSFVENTAAAQAVGYLGGAFTGLGGGGAILNVTGIMTITRSHFHSNVAMGGPGGEGSLSGGAGFGGAILSGDVSPFGGAESMLEISRSEFVGNVAMGGDSSEVGLPGGISAGGAIALSNGTDGRLSRNQFKSNQAVGGAGGSGASGGVATGGAVSAAGRANVQLNRNRFVENSADGGAGGTEATGAAGRGGALGSEFIDLAGFFPGVATVSSQNDTFHANTAVGGIGGGIYNEGDLAITGSRISENLAEGAADVAIDFVPGYQFLGAALGGGVSNLGTLEMSRVTVSGNQAVGADETLGRLALIESVANYPGLAVGGGLHNINQAMVTQSQFVRNEALGGHGNFGSFAGVSNGGGIYNDSSLNINRSSILNNRAVGGNQNAGDINAGGGYGGGITSGTVTALNAGQSDPEIDDALPARSADLIMDRVTVSGNEAIGGDFNSRIELPIELPSGHLPSGGIGGGIVVYQGAADLSRSRS